MTVFVDC